VTPPRADARRNREAVLRAALRLFRADPAATVAEVAAAAGVGRVTLYGHFPTRTDLVAAALEDAVARADAALRRHEDEADPAVALGGMLRAAWPALEDGHGAVAAACRELPAAEVVARHDPVLAPLRAVLARGVESGAFRGDQPVAWSVAAVSALVHAAAEQVTSGAMPAEEAADHLVRSALAVVAAGSPGGATSALS